METPAGVPGGLEDLVESVWRAVDGRLPRARVLEIVAEVAAEFQGVAITAYVPIFIARRARARLSASASAEGAR